MKRVNAKFWMLACAASFLCMTFPAVAIPYTAESVEELIEHLQSAGPNDIVVLKEGVYELPSQACSTNTPGGTGLSHLYVNTRLVGGSADRSKTMLVGTGDFRILGLSARAIVENLTISNGYAKVYGENYPNSMRGGGAYGYGRMVNCAILNCQAQTCAGGIGGEMTLERCLVRDCSASSGGAMRHGIAIDCDFICNTATEEHGGALYSVVASGCHVLSNTCAKIGGGAYQMIAATNCIFVANKSYGNGGGVGNYSPGTGRLVNCDIIGNSAISEKSIGGGVLYVDVYGGNIHDNYAAGNGGGVYGSVCRKVALSNNICSGTGNNGYDSNFFDCIIEGTDISWGSATRCVFKGIGETVSLTGNPHKEMSIGCTQVWIYFPNATNCLFRDNNVSSYLFRGGGAAKRSSTLVNCTVVSNVCPVVISGFKDPEVPFTAENSVFFGNKLKNGTLRDLSIANGTFVSFSRVAFASSLLSVADYPEGALLQFGVGGFGEDPKFAGGEEHPYSLLANSPLRGRGVYASWMAGASDIRAGARYRRAIGESVDIGCYQYWTEPSVKIIVR